MYKKYKLKEQIQDAKDNIFYYNYLLTFSLCPYIRHHFMKLKQLEIKKLKKLIIKRCDEDTFKNISLKRQKELTLEELSNYNGEGGKPAYVVVNGIVYDVSVNPAWGGGTHYGLYSGKDLTGEFSGCHMGNAEVLNSIPKIGTIKK
ncbi:cytochrome b5 domain-containing protein [Clostridium sp. OS1-26]|uniref:cytochrome b5 domain-containing protein n=1 Tax=Clostridium sp. OS1-26 TaxID=3070681 RepID=UPI0027E1DAF5|nr:cytochrome b5 domain-containing protein [Clostridium sp. OS1-26]WML35240.1 cytochrome b5 domain-containing protein [Clostridium sp. OS1-26]